MTIEYKIREVTRYIVTRFENSSKEVGEFDNKEQAYEVGNAMAFAERERLGWPPGDERMIFPDPHRKEDQKYHVDGISTERTTVRYERDPGAMTSDLVFAKAGEPVTTPDGKVICYVKNDLRRRYPIMSGDFHEFQGNNEPWRPGMPTDPRCVRETRIGGMQICINGEWRP